MPTYYHNLCRKVEDVLLAYIRNTSDPGTAVNLYRAIDVATGSTRIAYPCVSFLCPSSRPMSDALDATSGATNRIVQAEIHVKTWLANEEDGGVTVATARDHHDTLVGRIMDSLHSGTLVTDLNAQGVPGVTIDQVDLPAEEIAIDNGALTTRLTFAVLAYSGGL